MRIPTLSLCLCGFLATIAWAANDNQFTNPDGNSPDNSQIYTVGTTMSIDYKKGWFGLGTPQAFVDLYITSFEDGRYLDLLAQNISLDKDGSTRWTINVPPEKITSTNKYVFRLVQARTKPDYTGAAAIGMSPSRGFVLRLPSTSSIATPSVSTSQASSTTSSTVTAAANSGIPASDNKFKTPVGAIVGGTIGGVALIALGVVAFFLLKRRKNKTRNAEYYQPPMATYPYGDEGAIPPKYKDVASHQGAPPQELHGGGQIHEADSNYEGPRR